MPPASDGRCPFPADFWPLLVGVVLAWVLESLHLVTFNTPHEPYAFALCLPHFLPKDAFALLFSPWDGNTSPSFCPWDFST